MTNLQKLQAQRSQIESQLNIIERKDTSYKSGRYFHTREADLDGVIVLKTIKRTKHLNTYICVAKDQSELADSYKFTNFQIEDEEKKMRMKAKRKSDKEAPKYCIDFANRQIKDGTINTNYYKEFIVGNSSIYACHPYYKHSDYNKWCAMPNTSKNRKLAEELNEKMRGAQLVNA